MSQSSQVGVHIFLRITITETIGVDDGDCENEVEDTNVKNGTPFLGYVTSTCFRSGGRCSCFAPSFEVAAVFSSNLEKGSLG